MCWLLIDRNGSAMNERIRELLSQITALEDELRSALQAQEERVAFEIKGKRIEFEQSVRQTHVRLKTGFFRWLVTYRPLNLITGPIIYSMIVPLLLLDLCVSLYQLTCFPIYRIDRVRRADYIVFDHQHLAYLNFIEKFHCGYCSYATGLLAYVTEIVACTEQYFCPIKHARKMLGAHARYPRFLDYGDAADYAARLEEFRQALEKEKS
jgi:predicted membrane-bound dolichyl-phosphate-mannose-protein mannosyltransferase